MRRLHHCLSEVCNGASLTSCLMPLANSRALRVSKPRNRVQNQIISGASLSINLSRTHRHLQQSLSLLKSKHQIHILHSLSRSTFHQVIHSPHHNNSVSSRIDLKVHIHIITSFHTLSLRTNILIKHTNESLILIILIINCLHLFIRNILSQRSISSHQNTTVHRNQMRCKINQHLFATCITKLILNLRCMSVSCNTISLNILVYFTEQIGNLRSTSCS